MDDAALGLDAIREAGPGGHIFGTAHTLERYESAFYRPLVSDWSNYENWRDAGARDAAPRAHSIWMSMLKEYEPPSIDQGIREALVDFVDRRKSDLKPWSTIVSVDIMRILNLPLSDQRPDCFGVKRCRSAQKVQAGNTMQTKRILCYRPDQLPPIHV